ncbi:chromate transporter [Porphyromonas gingivalis]|uniref:chromate transporter n=1 Tax=Porphyromonas gingivalis TaxID=837 RepID=UPI001E563D6E|nr:chromate transporter [Porphyromonas gingivalis]
MSVLSSCLFFAVNPYLSLFLTFFRIGGFTFGGGYAMLPLIKADIVDKHHWLSEEDFLDLFAVAQSLPGVFAVNISIFVGYRLRGYAGAAVCALGTILPSFLIILAVAMFFAQMRDNKIIAAIFRGLRPAVIAMIAAPAISTWKVMKMKAVSLWIPILAAILVWYAGISPVWIILVAAALGILYSRYLRFRIRNMHS